MSEQLFDVVFFGILQAGKDKETALQNMAKLFKTDAARLEPYFGGGRKIIKGKIKVSTAEKYKAALENIGLVVKLEHCKAAQSEQPAQSPNSSQKTTEPKQGSDSNVDTGDITVAPLGADVIKNPVEVPAQEIDDISDLTMAEAGTDIIENPVEVPAQKIEDISGLSMAEVGRDVLDHPQEVVPQKIADISDISLAEAGADIIANPKPKEKADIPDSSRLSLTNENG